ncbi:hypothetical protein AA0112_g12558 [Alternaria arborescens]|nr:hypothetical protein AA0112_g12558 [Alternaria arborescens]
MPSSTSISKTGLNDDNVIFAANEDEVQRLDKQHKVVYSAIPQLFLAPIDLAEGWLRVLDQATGSGSYLRAEELFKANEESYFPKETPNDTSYHHQTMNEPWPLKWQGTFDLVHSRMALPGVGLSSLDDAVMNLVKLVKPGGWFQLIEM